MNRLLLIDAYAMIYRAYYAFMQHPRLTSDGRNTSAVYGFLLTLDDLLRKLNPTHVGVAFDPKGKTFRHEAYEQYKAQREATPEDIHAAVPVIKDILAAMRIPVLEKEGFEADDVIGTLAAQAETAGFEVKMATPDKDYGQLVTPNVHMYRPRHSGGFEDMGPEEVCLKYGLQSTLQVIDLLALMGDASDNIPGCKGVGEKTAVKLLQDFGNIDNLLAHTDRLKGALRTKVETQTEAIRFSRFLATIRRDVPVTFDEAALRRREPDKEALTRLYTGLEFRSLLRNMEDGSAGQAAPSSRAPRTVPAAPLQPDLFSQADAAPQPAAGTAALPDLFAQDTPAAEQPQYDTPQNRIVSYLLNPELTFNPYRPPRLDLLRQNDKLWRLYNEVELPLIPVLDDMMAAGVRIDTAMLRRAEEELTAELNALEQEIRRLSPVSFNINSPRQVGDLLFDTLRLDPKAKRTRSGQYVTSEEVLQELTDRHPVVQKILDYRELKKLISTYIAPLPTYINPRTGKIHATYHQTVTATGRLSCSNPNLQNLPIRSERGKLIRRAVIPDPGCVFLSADYSQIELRLMAHFSQDEHLIAAFREGQDIHAATAAKIFGCPIEEVSKDMRRRAKTANFGIIYGISPFGLSQQLGASRQEAKELIDGYFASFPRIAQFIAQQKELARSQGYVETLFGRRRYLPDINSRNATVRNFAERNAVNAPIQGTAADIIKMAMVAIHRVLKQEGLNAQMTMQVHDELNFNVPEAELERVQRIVVEQMQSVASLSVPLVADAGSGSNWLLAH